MKEQLTQRVFAEPADLAEQTGAIVGYSGWIEVTQAKIDLFAEATGDHQWIHVDVERAAGGPFGRTIAHGYLSLALIPALQGDVFRVKGISMGINYGLESVRFPSPVVVGSRVRLCVEFVEVVRTPRGFRLTSQSTLQIEGSDKPGCVARAITLYVPLTADA